MANENEFHGNQLLFNITNAAAPMTMSTKFQSPKPIIIEKIPVSSTPPRLFGPASSTLKFSAISADSLSQAVDLARQDLRRRNLVSARGASQRQRSPTKVVHTPTKVVRSRSYKDQLRKRHGRHSSPVMIIKERSGRKPSRNAIIQTEKVVESNRRYDPTSLPARSSSPPTRDHREPLSHRSAPVSHEDKVLGEICRLRSEMTKCLQQMRSIKQQRELQTANNNNRGSDSRPSFYTEDVEEERKRKVRTEERATRSVRMIYQLMRKTNELHEEIRRLDTKTKIDMKKDQVTSRLAALHRGVVKALQLVVQQMADEDGHRSVGRNYHDLAVIIRQLSICCAQLEVTNESSKAQDDLLLLLKDVIELNEIVDKSDASSSKSPARSCRSSRAADETKKLRFETAVSDNNFFTYRHPIEKVRVRIEELGENITKAFPSREIPSEKERRKAILAAGLQTIIKTNADNSREPAAARSSRQQRARKTLRCANVNCHFHRKGVLVNHKNVTGIPCRCGRWRRSSESDVLPTEFHYAVPTVSTSRKQTAVYRSDRPPPLRAPSPSPSRTSFPSTNGGGGGWHFAEPTYSKMRKEVEPASPSRPASPPRRSRSSSPVSSPRLTPRKSRSLSKNVRSSEFREEELWRMRMERDVRNRMEPIVDSGLIEMDVNRVTDLIVDDMLDNMAMELHDRREENRIDDGAAVMKDAPDVEAILQRLRQMEMEQDEIRRRWVGLAYDEHSGASALDVSRIEDAAPGSPLPLEIIAGANRRLPATLFRSSQVSDVKEPIIFTKPYVKTTLRTTDYQLDKTVGAAAGVVLRLQSESLRNIRQQVEDFDEFLKRQVNERVDLFDPWKVVEDVADHILESCLSDVCSELVDFSNDIVDHVYQAEFAVIPPRHDSQ